LKSHIGVLQPRKQSFRFGLFRFRSPLLTESHSFSIPPVTEMFHFTGYCVSFPILFRKKRLHINGARLPHSEISGSEPVCGSPKLIAAYHVLHRLLAPRHPLYALNNLIPISRNRAFQSNPKVTPDAETVLKQFQQNLPFYISIFLVEYFQDCKINSSDSCSCIASRTEVLLALQLGKKIFTWMSKSDGFTHCALPDRKGAWWARLDLNQRPHAYQACALTN
jgi:hypothetical protein